MGTIPENCNGISRIDEEKDFSKINCKWSKKAAGRKPFTEKPPKERKRRSLIKNPKSICLVLEKDHLDFIKNQALQRSVKLGVYVETNELIREALQTVFPTPKQFDMFGNRK